MLPVLIVIDALPEGVWLSAEEVRRRDAFPGDKRRRDWELGRVAGKLAVAQLLESEGRRPPDPVEIEIASSVRGAPRVVAEGPVALSLTHGHGRAGAFALRPGPGGGLPGIDLERARPRGDSSLRFFLSPAEQARVLAEPRPTPERVTQRDRLALTYWSLKEAAFKAVHLPQGLGLLDVAVELPATGSLERGRADVRYVGRALEHHQAVGAGAIEAGWEWVAPSWIVAWVRVCDASLPGPE